MRVDDLKNKIQWYSNRFRVNFVLGENYSLFPQNGEYGWPKPWKNPDSAGIYALLDSDKNVVYIGTTSKLGKRLNHYFGYGENGKCVLKDKRVSDIFYVITYLSQPDEPYTCLSLEGFLIAELNPKFNKNGRTEW